MYAQSAYKMPQSLQKCSVSQLLRSAVQQLELVDIMQQTKSNWPHTSLTALCPGLPGWAGTRKVKPSRFYWSKRQWHQLGHMQVCTSLQTDNHTSILPLSFLQAGRPSCCPTNSVKALKAQKQLALHNKIPTECKPFAFRFKLSPLLQKTGDKERASSR